MQIFNLLESIGTSIKIYIYIYFVFNAIFIQTFQQVSFGEFWLLKSLWQIQYIYLCKYQKNIHYGAVSFYCLQNG